MLPHGGATSHLTGTVPLCDSDWGLENWVRPIVHCAFIPQRLIGLPYGYILS